MRRKSLRMTFEQTTRAGELWKAGRDTLSIAQALALPESVIACQIATMRDIAVALSAPQPAPLQLAA